MNRKMSEIAIGFGLSMLIGSATVMAGTPAETARVPFTFEVMGKKLAPGTYTAYRVNSGCFRIQNVQTGSGSYILPMPANRGTGEESKLTFKCYGGHCFLSQLQFGETQTSYVLPVSKREAEMATVKQPEVKMIAAR